MVGGIAQAEIEPLRADRRDDVRGFADERDARWRQSVRAVAIAERKQAAAGLDRDLAEDRMRRAVRSRPTAPRRRAPRSRSASAGSSTQTRLERLPGSGTSVNGPVAVWNSVEMSRCGRLCARHSVSATCG